MGGYGFVGQNSEKSMNNKHKSFASVPKPNKSIKVADLVGVTGGFIQPGGGHGDDDRVEEYLKMTRF